MVFVVDDDPSVCKALKRLLSSSGFAVETFGSAEEVLKSGRCGVPDVLVIDVRMPGMTGLELQRQLVVRGVEASIIFITAHEDAQARIAALAAGAAGFLQKPFDERTLLEAVETGLKRKALELPNAEHLRR
jgi:FixJ family two-component response regulator